MTTQANELFGRDAELASVLGLVASGERLVTLIGPAGVGKSALASAIGQRTERAIVVDASGPLDARELVRRVARAAALPPLRASRRAGANPVASVAAALDEGVALMVLDDVEHVEPTREVLAALLESSKRVCILVTSQVATGVRGDVVVEVAPLGVDAGVALFHARSPQGHVSEAVNGEEQARAVRALVERLDGLPLAIVLAAARSTVLSVDAMLERLDEPLGLLRGGTPHVSPRHATLEHALETSFASLSVDERVAFACASVFEGTFSADAFEAVSSSAIQSDALDAIEALLRKSLIERSTSPGAVRFRLLHVIRAFARKHARDGGREEALRARYEAYVELAASQLATETYGPRAERALSDLEQLLPDVLSAFGSALADRPGRAAALWVALFDVILFREVVPLDDARFAVAIGAADRAGRAEGDVGLRVRARVLRARAILELGPPDRATDDLREALAMSRASASTSNDAALVSEVQRSLGWMELACGRPEDALRELEAALASSVSVRDARGHADALAAMGLAEHLLGRPARGRESLVLARALHAQQKDDLRRRRVDDMLRLVTPPGPKNEDGDQGESAEQALLDAAATHEARGQSVRLALDMALLADLEEARGDHASATEHRLRARAAAHASGLGPLEEAIGRRPLGGSQQPGWTLGEGARTLRTPGGESIDLVRHGSLRLVLDALVSARIETPGVALTASDVLRAGWPGERVLHDAGLLRVYSAIRRLRRMGLETALVTRDDGYLLDPLVRFERGRAEGAEDA